MNAEKQYKKSPIDHIRPIQEKSQFGFVDNRTLFVGQKRIVDNIQKKPMIHLSVSLPKILDKNVIQGEFTVNVNPKKNETNEYIVDNISIGERPPTEDSTHQNNHSVPWNAIVIELNGALKGKTLYNAYMEVFRLAQNKGLYIGECVSLQGLDDLGELLEVEKIIKKYLSVYNLQPGITHKDKADFTSPASARYAPENARKILTFSSNSRELDQKMLALMNKTCEQIVTSADPGKSLTSDVWIKQAASTMAQTAVFFLTGENITSYMDYILNTVSGVAMEKIGIQRSLVFKEEYIQQTTKLLKLKGWDIDQDGTEQEGGRHGLKLPVREEDIAALNDNEWKEFYGLLNKEFKTRLYIDRINEMKFIIDTWRKTGISSDDVCEIKRIYINLCNGVQNVDEKEYSDFLKAKKFMEKKYTDWLTIGFTVFIRNLPFNFLLRDFVKYFSGNYFISRIDGLTKGKGIAYVTFASIADATAFINTPHTFSGQKAQCYLSHEVLLSFGGLTKLS